MNKQSSLTLHPTSEEWRAEVRRLTVENEELRKQVEMFEEALQEARASGFQTAINRLSLHPEFWSACRVLELEKPDYLASLSTMRSEVR